MKSLRSWTGGRESITVELGITGTASGSQRHVTKIEMCKSMVLLDAAVAISISMGANHSICPIKVDQDGMLQPFFARKVTKRSYAPSEFNFLVRSP